MGVVVVVGIAAWAIASRSEEQPSTPGPPPTPAAEPPLGAEPQRALPGELAPQFRLPQLGGGADVALAELRGKPVVLNFWASWCLPCRAEFPALAAALDTYPDLEIIGIAFRDLPSDSLAFADEFGATWPLLEDEGGAIARAYGVRALPQTFFILPDGVIMDRMFAFTEDELFRRIDALLAGARQVASGT